jgi:hypothetical protein
MEAIQKVGDMLRICIYNPASTEIVVTEHAEAIIDVLIGTFMGMNDYLEQANRGCFNPEYVKIINDAVNTYCSDYPESLLPRNPVPRDGVPR